MRDIRLFVGESFRKGEILSLGKENNHILGSVLRKTGEDEVFLINGMGQKAKARVSEAKKDRTAEILEVVEKARPEPDVVLIQSPPKGDAFDNIVRQAVEWGVAEIHFLQSEYGVRKLSSKTLRRAQKISVEALRQSENFFLPDIHQLGWEDLTQLKDHLCLLCDERKSSESMMEFRGSIEKNRGIAIAIGPEGGWSEGDRERFFEVGFQSVTLADYILKSDTASVSAVALAKTIFDHS